jgi:hypothetical protein
MSYVNVNTDFINWSAYPPSGNAGPFTVVGVTGATALTLNTKSSYILNGVAYNGSSYNGFVCTVAFPSTVNGEVITIIFNGFIYGAIINDQTVQLIVNNPANSYETTFIPGSSSSNYFTSSFQLIGYGGNWFVVGGLNTGS